MSGLIKYRVHEVAKDFNMTSKEITQILTDYATTPKNHMQVLEDDELNDIFEYLTQHHHDRLIVKDIIYSVAEGDVPKLKDSLLRFAVSRGDSGALDHAAFLNDLDYIVADFAG